MLTVKVETMLKVLKLQQMTVCCFLELTIDPKHQHPIWFQSLFYPTGNNQQDVKLIYGQDLFSH